MLALERFVSWRELVGHLDWLTGPLDDLGTNAAMLGVSVTPLLLCGCVPYHIISYRHPHRRSNKVR